MVLRSPCNGSLAILTYPGKDIADTLGKLGFKNGQWEQQAESVEEGCFLLPWNFIFGLRGL